MDCPHKIPPSGTPANHHKLPEVIMSGQVQDITVKRETGEANPDHHLIFKDITAQVIAIHAEHGQGYNTGINAATTGTAHTNHTSPIEPTAMNLPAAHHIDHITDQPHIGV